MWCHGSVIHSALRVEILRRLMLELAWTEWTKMVYVPQKKCNLCSWGIFVDIANKRENSDFRTYHTLGNEFCKVRHFRFSYILLLM